MNKIILIIIGIVVLGLIVVSAPLDMTIHPEGSISVFVADEAWNENKADVVVRANIINQGPLGSLYCRIIDRDTDNVVRGWSQNIVYKFWIAFRHIYLPTADGGYNDFHGRFQVGHKEGESIAIDDYKDFTIEYVESFPPTCTAPVGPSTIVENTVAQFYTDARDPDGTGVSVQFDWGDGSTSSWGEASRTHVYETPGTYDVKAKAKDSAGLQSSWSPSAQIIVTEESNGGGGGNNYPPDDPTKSDLMITVKDFQTFEPIGGVNIMVTGDGFYKEGTTLSDGTTTFYNLESGSYTVSFVKNGYESYQNTVNLDSDTTINVKIKKQSGYSSIPGFEAILFIFSLLAVVLIIKRFKL